MGGGSKSGGGSSGKVEWPKYVQRTHNLMMSGSDNSTEYQGNKYDDVHSFIKNRGNAFRLLYQLWDKSPYWQVVNTAAPGDPAHYELQNLALYDPAATGGDLAILDGQADKLDAMVKNTFNFDAGMDNADAAPVYTAAQADTNTIFGDAAFDPFGKYKAEIEPATGQTSMDLTKDEWAALFEQICGTPAPVNMMADYLYTPIKSALDALSSEQVTSLFSSFHDDAKAKADALFDDAAVTGAVEAYAGRQQAEVDKQIAGVDAQFSAAGSVGSSAHWLARAAIYNRHLDEVSRVNKELTLEFRRLRAEHMQQFLQTMFQDLQARWSERRALIGIRQDNANAISGYVQYALTQAKNALDSSLNRRLEFGKAKYAHYLQYYDDSVKFKALAVDALRANALYHADRTKIRMATQTETENRKIDVAVKGFQWRWDLLSQAGNLLAQVQGAVIQPNNNVRQDGGFAAVMSGAVGGASAVGSLGQTLGMGKASWGAAGAILGGIGGAALA